MRPDIAFYVHHHGSGHLMRCLAISAYLTDAEITFLGSHLAAYIHLIPARIRCIHLPMDTPGEADIDYSETAPPAGLHYAPLHVVGQRARVQMMSRFFADNPRLLLVVDVSAEVAMLARLCGVPTIVVRQHGNRTDLPHELAYRNAQLLLAPYPASLAGAEPEWIKRKTYYTGGFSRFDRVRDETPAFEPDMHQRRATLLVGSGGTSLDMQFVQHLGASCPDWQFEVLGLIKEGGTALPANVKLRGNVANPLPYLNSSSIIIGNTGHNTVMEVAALGKRFITIPEQRPFEEQVMKAQLLAHLQMATVIMPDQLFTINWPELLAVSLTTPPRWQGIIDPQALPKTAARMQALYRELFTAPPVMA